MKLLEFGKAMPCRGSALKKLLLIMKLTTSLLLFAVMQVSANGFSQVISISKKNVALGKIFSEIQQQSGFSLLYNSRLIKTAKNIDINVRNVSVEEALSQCLKGLPLTYVISEKIIIIREKEKTEETEVVAPDQPVTGTITDSTGKPLDGASVFIKELKLGTRTNANGVFLFSNVPPGTYTLTISYVGYEAASQTITVGNQTVNVSLSLKAEENKLQDVVVTTALGIQRKAKSITYATQSVAGSELTRVKDVNPFNSLIGKVAGLQINRSSSGIGGSVRITLRGNKSTRNNQPLYVIDGVPMTNTEGSGSDDAFGGTTDKGDILSMLNPDDIENINVLKGASASALYGSQGSNGVILITTKKGKAGNVKIDFSSDFTLDKAAYTPNLQYKYGQTVAGAMESWGAAGNFADPVKDFFNTGKTFINSVSLSGGTDQVQNYFSYANTENSGIMPTTTFRQNAFTFRQSGKFLDNKLSFDGTIMYSDQRVHNRVSSGIYYNPLTGLYLFPRGLDFNKYKNSYEYFSSTRNMYLQDWWNINADAGMTGQDNQQNPYWIMNRNPNDQKRQNLIATVSLGYPLTSWLRIQARGTLNKLWDDFNRNSYAGTQAVLSGVNGRYQLEELEGRSLYGDILLTGSRNLSPDFGLNFTLGTSINDFKQTGYKLDAKNLVIPNVFQLSNLSQTAPVDKLYEFETIQRWQRQSVFATASINYQEKIYVDLTARNDWSSTLAFTPNMDKGYFYWSAGIGAVLTDLVRMPAAINYGKVRFSYAEVGNDVKYFSTLPTNKLSAGVLTAPNSGPYKGIALKPELNKSYEIGTEWRLFNNRLNFDFTWYKSNVLNQYVEIDVPLGFLTSKAFLNAGNIQNKGIELSLGYDVFKDRTVNWNTAINFTRNKNTVVRLAPGLSDVYKGLGGSYYVLRVGGSFGDLWGKTFLRDKASGNIVVDATGRPQGGPDGYLGNTNPDFMLGWNNTVRIKRFTIGVLVDGRFGGKVLSLTQGYLNSFGVSRESADARDAGGVIINAVKVSGGAWTGPIPADQYYQGIGNRGGIDEAFIYSATNARLRELSVSYTIPATTKVIKNIRIGLIARNLFFIKRDAPYDPELSISTGTNKAEGFDVFGLPSTRSFGLNLKCAF